MDISPQEFKDIQSFFTKVDEEPGLECEARFKNINKEAFTRVIQYVMSQPEFNSLGESQVLDISLATDPEWKGYRYHLTGGTPAVVRYCKTGLLPAGMTVDKKQSLEDHEPIFLKEYNIKMNLAREVIVEDEAPLAMFVRELNSVQTLKHYRYKKRYSFQRGPFRIDLSAIKEPESSRTVGPLFKVRDDKYEIEMEYTAVDPKKKKNYPHLIHEAFGIIGNILQAIQHRPIIMKESAMQEIRKKYAILVSGDTRVDMKNLSKYRIGPQPVTLEKKDAIEKIGKNYAVTEKADGLRYILYIDDTGRGYLVNKLLDIIDTGMTFETGKSSILDGELLRVGRMGIPLFQFLVFDIYVYKGRKIMELPFMNATECRLTMAKSLIESRITKNIDIGLSITVKEFLTGENIFKQTKTILDKDKKQLFMYHIDGVIFTPMGPISNKKVKEGDDTPFFKWKPNEESTFDLRVRYVPGATNVNIENMPGEYKLAKLYVGGMQDTELSPINVLENRVVRMGYRDREFETCYLPLKDGRVVGEKSHETVDDGVVAEFAYDITRPPLHRWIPRMVRHDKFKDGPNNDSTAYSVMRSILNPVTIEMITGLEPMTLEEDGDGEGGLSYYQANVGNRENSEMKPMLDFHNTWVKNHHLIMRFKGHATRLFDIGVGRAADLNKWMNAGFMMVVGVDESRDNIYSSDSKLAGAWWRYQKLVKEGRRRGKMLFMVMDAGQLWTPDYIETLQGENQYLAKTVFGSRISDAQVTEASIKPFYKAAQRGFQVVSCQFAIHYFFKNLQTLDIFCENVRSVCASGGYFIGTCFDGFLVHQLLEHVPKGGHVQELDSEGRIMWRITKEYTGDYDSAPGRRITNYNTRIGKAFDEYLVDYGVLCERMAVGGFHPLSSAECSNLGLATSSGTFEELYTDMAEYVKTGGDTSEVTQLKNALTMDSKQRTYSFLNRWFIFKRV